MKGEKSHYRLAKSPRKEALSSELDHHSNRIKELLREDLTMMEEENAILKAKCKKVSELEDKVDQVLRQNSQLLAENERLTRMLHQSKAEMDLLRSKQESHISQRVVSTESDYEKKKLLNEIEHLNKEIRELQSVKSMQLNEVKSQYQLDFQSLKRQNITSQEVYEQEIRKLRELLDKKDYEVSEYAARLKKVATESEYDMVRLKDDKEKLKSELLYLEADRKKDLEGLRLKLDANYLEQIETIKRNHLNNLESLEIENLRLKDHLDEINKELLTVSSKNQKNTGYYEDNIHSLQRENDSLRHQLMELERISEGEKSDLKNKLNEIHDSEIGEIQYNHQKYVECLQTEINKLEGGSTAKNQEIEQLIKEKVETRNFYDRQLNRLKEEVESYEYKLKDAEIKLETNGKQYEEKVQEKERHNEYLDNLIQDQRVNNDKEVQSLKQIVEHLRAELETEGIKSRENQQQMKETINNLKHESTQWKDSFKKEKATREKNEEELRTDMETAMSSLRTKIESLTSKINILERENEALKNNIILKEKENKQLQARVKASEEREKRLEKDIDDMRNKMIKKDQKSNEMLVEQKQRLQNSFAYTIDNLRADHEANIRLEAQKISDLNDKLRKKEDELTNLLKMYKKMSDELTVLTEQQANKKDITLKFPGATADLIATKNLFDVFLKTKVLDVCGDALEKENK